ALPLWPVHPCPYRSRSTVVRVLPCQVLPFTVDKPVGAPCAGLQWMVGPGARPGRWIPYRRCGWGGTNLLQSVPLARCASGPSPRQANHTSASQARNRVNHGSRRGFGRDAVSGAPRHGSVSRGFAPERRSYEWWVRFLTEKLRISRWRGAQRLANMEPWTSRRSATNLLPATPRCALSAAPSLLPTQGT